MPRDGSGVFALDSGYLAVEGETILPSQHNPPLEDLASSMTDSISRTGVTVVTANIPFAGFRLTGVGDATAATDAVNRQFADARYVAAAGAADGTVAAPAFSFASDPDTGLYRQGANAISIATSGAERIRFTADAVAILPQGPIGLTAGLEATPSLVFTGDADTGMFAPAANQIGFSTSAVERFRLTAGAVSIQALGVLGVSDGTVSAPGFTFTSDSDTGIYRQGTNALSITTSGAERTRWSASDILNTVPLKIPNGTAGAPSITPFGDAATGIYCAGANSISISAGSVERVRFSNGSGQAVVAISGNTTIRGVGSSSSTFALYIDNSSASVLLAARDDGQVIIPGAFSITTANPANVNVNGDGSLARTTSSLRYKENVRDYGRGLADLAKLRPVLFNSKGGDGTDYAGFIAEEVDAAGMPEFVTYDDQGRPDALGYAQMVAILTKALQEAAAKIEALTSRVEALEG